MEIISQQYVIDAAAGIVSLGNLRSALSRVNNQLTRLSRLGVSGGLNNSAAAAQRAANSVGSFATRTNSASRSARTLSSSLASTSGGFNRIDAQIQRTARASQDLTITWATFSRIIATQFIVSQFGNIRRAIAESVSTAQDLQVQIGLIQTLLNQETDFGVTFSGIDGDLTNISNSFNIPIIETANAAYNALSNQIGDYNDALTVTAESALFARATFSTLNDSVDLLTSALVAFDLGVEETGRVSSLFFTVIDEGRITATELANSFGRVAAPAAALGVSLEEVGLAISSISVLGFRTSETLTQFRGILNSLNNPTVDLTEALRSIGFESGQTSVQAIGLIETLRRLQATTDGNAEAFSNLFPNIRGSTGILALLARDADEMEQSFNRLRTASSAIAGEQALLVLDTDAQVLGTAFNQLANAGVDLGAELLSLGRGFIDFTGGAEAAGETARSVLNIFRDTAVIGGAIGSVLALNAAFALLAANPIILPLGVLVAGFVGLNAIIRQVNQNNLDSFSESLNQLQSDFEDAEEVIARTNEGLLTTQRIADTQNFQLLGRAIADVTAAVNNSSNGIIDANAAVVSNTRAFVSGLIASRRRLVETLRAEVESIDGLIGDAQDSIRDLNNQSRDIDFSQSLQGLNEAQQVIALTTEAAARSRRAADQLARAGNDSDAIDEARQLFQSAQQLAEQARSTAGGDRGLGQRAAEQLQTTTRQQIRAEERLIQNQLRIQASASARADQEAATLEIVRQQGQILNDNASGLSDRGGSLTSNELASRQQATQQARQTLSQLGLGTDDLRELGNAFNIEENISRFRDGLTSDPIDLNLDIEGAVQRFRDALSASNAQLPAELSALQPQAEAVTGQDITTNEQLQQALILTRQQAEELRVAAAAAATAEREVNNLLAARAILLDNLDRGTEGGVQVLTPLATPAQQDTAAIINSTITALATLRAEIARPAPDTNVVNQLLEDLQELRDNAQVPDGAGLLTNGLGAETTAIRDQTIALATNVLEVDRQTRAITLRAAALQLAIPEDRRDAITGLAADAQRVTDQLIATGQIQLTGPEASLRAMVEDVREVETRFNNVVENAANGIVITLDVNQNVNIREGTPTPTPRQFGAARFLQNGGTDLRYLQGGGSGLSRGVDTVPIVAEAGESLVSRRGTQRFFSQIQAINAGQQPVATTSSPGGSTSFGDVNVKITGGGNDINGREIAHAIQRELRRRSV